MVLCALAGSLPAAGREPAKAHKTSLLLLIT
jgi:hypothetical protein